MVSTSEDSDAADAKPTKTAKSKAKKKKKATKPKAKAKAKSKTTKGKGKSKSKSAATRIEKEMHGIDDLKAKHRELLGLGFHCVVGVDEAGRGPLAGPVVIGAAYVPMDVRIEGIDDSKKINDEAEREKLFEQIQAHPQIEYSVSVLDHEAIDEHNILEASMMGMRQCVEKLHDQLIAKGAKGVDYALADGNRDPRFRYPEGVNYEYIIKGDSKVYCIGAASICAKVVRDRMMIEYDKKWPQFGFAQHKGYPTPTHKATVTSKGPCEIHRKSFRPVKDWYMKHQPEVHEKWDTMKKEAAERRKERIKAEDAAMEAKENGEASKKEQKAVDKMFAKGKSTKGKKKKSKKGKGKKKNMESDDE